MCAPGDNKFTAGIFARNPQDGRARWFYQLDPHDLFDHDAVNELVLMGLELNGGIRHVIVRPDRNGLMYVSDRKTGEVLSADAFTLVNSNHGVDLKTIFDRCSWSGARATPPDRGAVKALSVKE